MEQQNINGFTEHTIEKVQDRAEFTEQIIGKFREIEMLCLKHKVPCFLTCALEGDGITNYLHTTITPQLVGVKLTDNKIDKFNAALNSNITMVLNTKEPSAYMGDMFDEVAAEDDSCE